jgi:hypothetical protein
MLQSPDTLSTLAFAVHPGAHFGITIIITITITIVITVIIIIITNNITTTITITITAITTTTVTTTTTTTPPPGFAADPGARFITTSFLGLMLDICVMQPSRVVAVAVIMVCCLLAAVCCLLSAVCCLLSAVCCLLSAVCWLLSVWLLSAVCRLSIYAARPPHARGRPCHDDSTRLHIQTNDTLLTRIHLRKHSLTRSMQDTPKSDAYRYKRRNYQIRV